MKPINEALKLTDASLLLREINQRKEGGRNSTETLYPKQLLEEIAVLTSRLSSLKKKK